MAVWGLVLGSAAHAGSGCGHAVLAHTLSLKDSYFLLFTVGAFPFVHIAHRDRSSALQAASAISIGNRSLGSQHQPSQDMAQLAPATSSELRLRSQFES